jgi:hypothetical protein
MFHEILYSALAPLAQQLEYSGICLLIKMKSVSHGNETWQTGDWFAAACVNRIIRTLGYYYY